ncbi:unknown product [Escherichia phage BA14]|uniref:Uncharacterized protein n=1 Tax=Escherichia phage BA14 TaxID=532074 RepID=B3VCQ3_9CAUD|nr:unknown product [Escherichia phage BA14]ACF15758.1 unknown product [Escherichia phage BA14]
MIPTLSSNFKENINYVNPYQEVYGEPTRYS